MSSTMRSRATRASGRQASRSLIATYLGRREGRKARYLLLCTKGRPCWSCRREKAAEITSAVETNTRKTEKYREGLKDNVEGSSRRVARRQDTEIKFRGAI